MRRSGGSLGKGSKLYVQPAELARKLVKEMEDHKVSRPPHVSVRNRYTIFLCPEDYERISERRDTLVLKLERHLAKYARSKKYDLPGDLGVEIVVDPDLKLGHFGILAERGAPGLLDDGLSPRATRESPPRATRESPPLERHSAPALVAEEPQARAEPPAPAERPRAAGAKPARKGTTPAIAWETNGATQIIPAVEASEHDLAWQTIVLNAGNREREFTQGRVIVGRAKDVDFRVEDSNVSRRHAAIFWSEGSVVIEDLGSTNGTMVNGYPISKTVIRSGDVIVIGDCRITVETR
jgi:hypothetical protein